MSICDLLLVRPGEKKRVYGNLGKSLAAVEPPMWVGLMASFARKKGFSVMVLDADAENLSPEEVAKKVLKLSPKMLGVVVSGTNPSASTMNMTAARRIIKQVKKEKANQPVFISGLHPSSVPEKTMNEERCDYLIEGETFLSLEPLLKNFVAEPDGKDWESEVPGLWYRKEGIVVHNNPASLIEDLDSLPMMAWDLLPMDKYRAHNWHCFAHPDQREPYAIIYTTLGCPFTCSFCCINAVFGGPSYRKRSPEKVVKEIGYLVENHGVKNIKFMDEMFVLHEKHVSGICDGIIENGYDLNIWAYARIDTVNEKMLNKLKQAGFNWLAFGIEAGNENIRTGVDKGRFGTKGIKEAIKMTRDAGIAVGANYIFGLPEDSLDTMQETLDLAVDLNCEYSNFYVAMAYPGSELYDDAIRENGGADLPQAWEGFAQLSKETLPLPTSKLTPSQILQFRDVAFHKYHSSQRYKNMLREKFGQSAVDDVEQMLQHKIERRYITEPA